MVSKLATAIEKASAKMGEGYLLAEGVTLANFEKFAKEETILTNRKENSILVAKLFAPAADAPAAAKAKFQLCIMAFAKAGGNVQALSKIGQKSSCPFIQAFCDFEITYRHQPDSDVYKKLVAKAAPQNIVGVNLRAMTRYGELLLLLMFYSEKIIRTLSFGRLPTVAAWIPIRNLSEFWLWKEDIPGLYGELEMIMDYVAVNFG